MLYIRTGLRRGVSPTFPEALETWKAGMMAMAVRTSSILALLSRDAKKANYK